MNSAQLKNDLQRLITETDDIDILKKIKETFFLLRNQVRSKTGNLTEYEKKMIDLGMQDMKKGKIISNEAVKEQFKIWVKSKQK